MPVRNEAWVLGLSARVALKWCDALVIYLHACTDDSRRIACEVAKEHAGRVLVVGNDRPEWDEMQHRQAMLELARVSEYGGGPAATHIAIIDADEVLTGNLLPDIRGHVESLPRGAILQLPGFNLRRSLNRYHASGVWGNRWFSCVFRDEAALHWGGDRFHAREPQGRTLVPFRPVGQARGGILHLWGSSERRLIAKHALYKITERLRWPGKPSAEIDRYYNLAIHGMREDNPRNWAFATVKPEWWEPYADLMQYLDVGAEPWQEAECARLIAGHGREKFAGLDLFGL